MKDNHYQDDLELIHNTIADTRFILDDAVVGKGISKSLFSWGISIVVSSSILFIISVVAQYLQLIDSMTYYSFYRILMIVLHFMPAGIYIDTLFHADMTLKELHFLKTFMFVPIFIAFFKILNPVSYYLNTDFFLSVFDNIPADIIILIFGLTQLYMYFKDKRFLILNVLSVIYVLIFSVIKMTIFQIEEITNMSMIILQINAWLSILNFYSLFLICIILISAYIAKNFKNER